MQAVYISSMERCWLFVVQLLVTAGSGFGQQAVLPAGHEAIGSSGTVSYSLGQIDYEATQAADGHVQRGVQQPYEWLILSAKEESPPSVNIRPNPTADEVTLQWSEPLPAGARYALYNNAGAVLGEGAVMGTSVSIPMERHATGRYIVRISVHDHVQHILTIQRQ